jgi:hypothetical protein
MTRTIGSPGAARSWNPRLPLVTAAAADVAAGQSLEITLPADGKAFETWTAHPETSACSGQ